MEYVGSAAMQGQHVCIAGETFTPHAMHFLFIVFQFFESHAPIWKVMIDESVEDVPGRVTYCPDQTMLMAAQREPKFHICATCATHAVHVADEKIRSRDLLQVFAGQPAPKFISSHVGHFRDFGKPCGSDFVAHVPDFIRNYPQPLSVGETTGYVDFHVIVISAASLHLCCGSPC